MELKHPASDYDGDQPDEIHYYLPAQVVLHLEHHPEISPGQLAVDLNNFFTQHTDPVWRSLRGLSPESIVTFPVQKNENLRMAIVPTRTVNEEIGKDEHADLLVQIYERLGERVQVPSASGLPVFLRSGSPNWLIGSAFHGGGTIGPGGWPDEAVLPRGDWPKFDFPGIDSIGPAESHRGAGVHLAILDTAPCLHDLLDAYFHWAEEKPGQHPLVESLLRPDGPLHVYPASYEDLKLAGDFSALGHRYAMPDHGLFVAGIIHTIANQATLHLYEVFHHYGLGCLTTIARGFSRVWDLLAELRNSGQPFRLVVNCSLMLGVTADGQEDPELTGQLRNPTILGHMRKSFEEMIADLDQPEVVVVAAAGNEARQDDTDPSVIIRPPARFPAAFRSVVGVGAAPRDLSEDPQAPGRVKTASYSNLADRTPEIGFVTIGGEEGVENGVVGLYLGRFPKNVGPFPNKDRRVKLEHVKYRANRRGWAWWSGTSFATPIVSGLLAAWWGLDLTKTPAEAKDFLNTSAQELTAENEKVIQAAQLI